MFVWVHIITKKFVQIQYVGEPTFLATPIFDRGKKVDFLTFHNTGMMGMCIVFFDPKNRILPLFLASDQWFGLKWPIMAKIIYLIGLYFVGPYERILQN